MKKLIAVWVLVALAGYSCAHQHESTRKRSAWELACADVAERYGIETCVDAVEPDVVTNSTLTMELTGAMGVTVYTENRIYLAPRWYIEYQGHRVADVKYHEMVHVVLNNDHPLSRCESEAVAREMSDARYGTKSSSTGWKQVYRCVEPQP